LQFNCIEKHRLNSRGDGLDETAPSGVPTDSAPGTARISAIWGLPALLGELGVDLDDTLHAVGLGAEIFSDRENRIEYPVFGRLLLECERRTGRDDFGMLMGQRTRLADFGLPGQFALCGATAAAGLENFVRFFNLHNMAAIVTTIASGEYARFVFAVCEPGMPDTRHFQLGSMAISFNILQDLCGPDWRPVEVNFACRSPSSVRPLQAFFQAPLRFNHEESSLVFERSWLDRSLPPIDPAELLKIERAVVLAHEEVIANFTAVVRRLLRKQLLLGRHSMDDIAATMSIHRRTLHRYLAEHGTRYADLLKSVKYEVARQLLVDTDMLVQDVAESLGFSSAANFATAFKNWSGTTPTEFRASRRN
jgi:AraC-like DNA-binding protein